MALIPPIGTSGIYVLEAPFSNKLQPNMSYRCDAIKRISDLIEVGVDPFEEFYVPNGIPRIKYEQDVANRVCIISLVSEADHWVYVPSTYVRAYPDVNGLAYTVMIVGLELGAIPSYMDLTGLKVALANLTRDTIGVMPTVREVSASAVQRLSQADHDVLESARLQAIVNSQTDLAKYLETKRQLDRLQQQYEQLEQYIIDNGLAP